MVEVLLYVHRNRRFIRAGEPRTSTSTFTQLLSSMGYAIRSMWLCVHRDHITDYKKPSSWLVEAPSLISLVVSEDVKHHVYLL